MSEPEIGGRRPIAINVVAGESYWWCACGRSKTQPFCDGSHKTTEFRPQEWKATANEEVWFCACKRSQHQPLCDGSHKKLPLRICRLSEGGAKAFPSPLWGGVGVGVERPFCDREAIFKTKNESLGAARPQHRPKQQDAWPRYAPRSACERSANRGGICVIGSTPCASLSSPGAPGPLHRRLRMSGTKIVIEIDGRTARPSKPNAMRGARNS